MSYPRHFLHLPAQTHGWAGWARLGRRRSPPVVGLTLGVFDFCHEGHLNLLRRAAGMCDRLVVGVHTDEEVRRYKGVQPANSELERAAAIRALGIAHTVVVGSDRARLCREHRVKLVFHGDDWDPAVYRRRWGEELIARLGLQLVLLPHTPGIDSTRLRAAVPDVGWWLYSSRPEWSRTHIFDHLRDLYARIGGVWFVGEGGRELVRRHFPDAPCALLREDQEAAVAAASIEHYRLDVIVTAHFNFDAMAPVLRDSPRPIALVALSHGRSGKPGTSADAARRRAALAADGTGTVASGNLTVHDWSFAPDAYLHCDGFLQDGGKIPSDWLARNIARIDKTQGDIDTLSRRLAFIRTWTYVAQRAGWVDDESHWRGETRAVEDRLSDALHAQLTAAFVDRRTSVLLRRLKQKESLVAEVNDKGEVTVEGEFIGRLEGFRFRQDKTASLDEARTLRQAAVAALAPAFNLRADKFYNAADTEMDFTEQGGLMWGTDAIGKLVAGPDPMRPQVCLLYTSDAADE